MTSPVLPALLRMPAAVYAQAQPVLALFATALLEAASLQSTLVDWLTRPSLLLLVQPDPALAAMAGPLTAKQSVALAHRPHPPADQTWPAAAPRVHAHHKAADRPPAFRASRYVSPAPSLDKADLYSADKYRGVSAPFSSPCSRQEHHRNIAIDRLN